MDVLLDHGGVPGFRIIMIWMCIEAAHKPGSISVHSKQDSGGGCKLIIRSAARFKEKVSQGTGTTVWRIVSRIEDEIRAEAIHDRGNLRPPSRHSFHPRTSERLDTGFKVRW
jgi:hypothetical protein